ncbi:hypothetical protein GGR58DRAFT_507967 [Xylaria digitata]|nr:hypothetical protein GGR58DRAFT_507967 [Xylaria digitata]
MARRILSRPQRQSGIPPEITAAPPSPRATGEVANCTSWYAPHSYDTCEGILLRFYATIDLFYTWNPSIGSECQLLSLGTYYCVSIYLNGNPPSDDDDDDSPTTTTSSTSSTGTGISTPTPTQSGTVKNRNEFYKVVKDDLCYDIAQEYDIELASFYAWNPAVGTDCSDLEANVYVCIGVSG